MDERMDERTDGSVDGLTNGWMDERMNGCRDGGMDERMDEWTDERMNDRRSRGMEEQRTRCTDEKMRGCIDEMVKTEVSDQTRQILETTSQSLHTFAQDIEQALQKMATQTNIAITALCEASEDLRKGLQSLDVRLAQLESDLDMEKAEALDLYHVDAGDYQVNLPELTPPALPGQDTEPEDDLAPVRNSIEDGKPNRDVLVDWINSKRSRESSKTSSYNVLANQLNEGGIPTLSGRDNWSRSTVRNLVVRSQAEEAEKEEEAEQE